MTDLAHRSRLQRGVSRVKHWYGTARTHARNMARDPEWRAAGKAALELGAIAAVIKLAPKVGYYAAVKARRATKPGSAARRVMLRMLGSRHYAKRLENFLLPTFKRLQRRDAKRMAEAYRAARIQLGEHNVTSLGPVLKGTMQPTKAHPAANRFIARVMRNLKKRTPTALDEGAATMGERRRMARRARRYARSHPTVTRVENKVRGWLGRRQRKAGGVRVIAFYPPGVTGNTTTAADVEGMRAANSIAKAMKASWRRRHR